MRRMIVALCRKLHLGRRASKGILVFCDTGYSEGWSGQEVSSYTWNDAVCLDASQTQPTPRPEDEDAKS